ncbi:hypothetical protein FEM48_ZijujUnG0111500 [Ziziphus jujuba var. spinosa]|uniref:Uncharacterized protein n=1 Tax=Ziziphus jujuba var. spinosa TaxID=714518 RepID=A0A978U806_ZIZJJ|nr:hypothetical protein FEM48_ZijujUnG0111500 [Ziziphus jujuba var. spinosa]
METPRSSTKMSRGTENQTLFKMAMKGKWREVVDLCQENLDLISQKITKTGATALHVAITENQFDAVRELVKLIIKDDKKEALRAKTEKGDTPIHLAASMGSTPTCRWMVEADPTLIGDRNIDGETPLFLAASHGKKRAFLYLHSRGSIDERYSYSKRADGDTTLHSAIEREFMDLAFLIILEYEKLVDSVNEKGYTALHLLAKKPAAFPSGLSVELYVDDEIDNKDKSYDSSDTSVDSTVTQEEETADVEKQATTSNNKDVQSKTSQESKKLAEKRFMFRDFIGFCATETLGLIEPGKGKCI